MRAYRESGMVMALFVLTGVWLRIFSHGEITPLRQPLATLPLAVGAWVGTAQEFAPNVLQTLRVDDYLLRQYRRPEGPPIGLYVGYYASMRQGATYHSPKNCLPGSGWSFIETGKTPLPVSPHHGRPVEVNQFVIQKGLEKQLVLYWYQDRGRILTSEYWAKLAMVLDAITRRRTDGAFVRITVPMLPQAETAAYEQGKAFAAQLLPFLQAHLPN